MTVGQESERIEFLRPPDMPGIEVLRAKNSARRWRVFHETYAACAVLKGKGEEEWTYRRKIHASRAGNLMLMEPGEVHSNTRITLPGDFDVLQIAPAVVVSAAQELDLALTQPHLRFANVTDPAIFRVFAGFHASLERRSGLLERQSRLAACIRALLERCVETPRVISPKPAAHPGLKRAHEFIRERYNDPISLDELATISGLSRYHFVRAFMTVYGLAPHAFQVHIRVAKARPLLAAGIPPAVVAGDLGFADQSHFTRHFKQIYGTTPGNYARAAR
jgi:AraC-like DNA-binding protein